MKSFRKNVLRLALQNKTTVIGSMIIIAIGIFTMIAMFDTLQNLRGQIEQYYEDNDLADVFITVRGMSHDDVTRLEDIDGVATAGGKLSCDVRMLCEGQEEVVSVHLMSYDQSSGVNRLTPDGNVNEESIFIGDRMSVFYGFSEGDPINIIINGENVPFRYAGVVKAPDYIYSVQTEGAMVPDGELYDIACISASRMEELMSMAGYWNELGLILDEGVELDDVRHELSAALEPYGLISMIDRNKQISTDMISGEMDELVTTGTVLPMLFMGISVYMLYMSLKKMIDRDQSLIGSMKAFGMTNSELLGAYMIEGLAIGAAGALIAWVTAIPFGKFMFDLYLQFFTLPDSVYHNYWNTRLLGLAIALATSLLAVLLGVRRVLGITPAMAMKSRSPAIVRAVHLPAGLTRHLNAFHRMELRSIIRNPVRGLLVVLAVAFPFSMASVLFAMTPTINVMLDEQFGKVMRYDMELTVDSFADPHELAQAGLQLEYVTQAEAVCALPIEVRHDNLAEFGMLYGLNEGSDMWRIMAQGGEVLDPPKNGLILNTRMAKKLDLREGDTVKVDLSSLGMTDLELPVAAIITEIFGGACYVDLQSFPHQLGLPAAANLLLIDVEDGHTADVKAQINETRRITGIIDAQKIVKSYNDTFGSMMIMVDMFSIVAIFAGAVLIYNISMISIRERFTELGTLEVIGAMRGEIEKMLLEENIFYSIFGILLGFPGAYGVKRLLEVVFISDTYSISILIPAKIYLLTAAMCVGMVLIAWRMETRLIRRIDLTDILKERE